MRNRCRSSILASIAVFAVSPILYAQTGDVPSSSKTAARADLKFDPHEIDGTWSGDDPRPDRRNFGSYDQKIPEPPLTDWGKQHLLYQSISHDALSGPHIPGWDRPGHVCPENSDPCYSADPNGVRANDADGEYPGKDCEPLSTPSLYDYPGLGSMELHTTREGDRIFQFFEYHREWRTFWLNRDHPKDLDPTYEGDSTARWEGNDLAVDTIGYNGKTMVTQNVGHSKSDAFRMEEHLRLVDRDHLTVEMTFYDPKAWGDKSWPGFKKYYHRVPKEDFQEFICSPREYLTYDTVITVPRDKVKKVPGK